MLRIGFWIYEHNSLFNDADFVGLRRGGNSYAQVINKAGDFVNLEISNLIAHLRSPFSP